MKTSHLLIVCATAIICSMFIGAGISRLNKAWEAVVFVGCVVPLTAVVFAPFTIAIIKAIRGDASKGENIV
ncbi:MAG: hypothetical protein NUV56_00245 [Candidatus Uhrbacteria bacterium]|nr:hypothetical protein [Candidatus Uhrbacteria bacterium]